MIDQQSHPAYQPKRKLDLLNSRKNKWMVIVFVTIFIPVFLLIFQPFGVNNFDPTYRIRWPFFIGSVLFGLMSGFTVAVYEFWLAPWLFKNYSWQSFLKRMAVCMVLLASTIFLLYNVLGGFHDWRLVSYFEFIGNISLMGSIPMVIILLYLEYRKVRSDFESAQRNAGRTVGLNQLLCLSSDQGNEQLSILPEYLLYIEAQGNYVFVYHLENGEIRKSLLRTTMKKLEKKLRPYGIMRCHRSFLVNTQQITKISGNTHQRQLHLPGLSESLPVSRSYLSAFESLLDVHPV